MRSIEELKQAHREVKDISPLQLRTDGGTQYRNGINDETMSQYREAMKDGAVFPPIETVFDGRHHWVVDGFHRLAAYSMLGRPAITVSCIDGTQAEAQLIALSVNAQHGLPRDHLTKRKIGEAALSHPAMASLSIAEIAKHTGLSVPFLYSLKDPEVKARQQQARDRSALKKIKLEVRNPIISADRQMAEQHHASEMNETVRWEDSAPISDNGAIPSQEEIEAAEEAFKANQEMFYKILESDDALKDAVEENKRLNLRVAQLEARLRGMMNEKNEVIRLLKTEQRRCERLRIELREQQRLRAGASVDVMNVQASV